MAQLPKDSDLFRRYVTKFTEQEDQVDALRKQVTGASKKSSGCGGRWMSIWTD